MSSEVFQALGTLLKDDGYETGVGDEGGYAPRLESIELAFEFMLRAICNQGLYPLLPLHPPRQCPAPSHRATTSRSDHASGLRSAMPRSKMCLPSSAHPARTLRT